MARIRKRDRLKVWLRGYLIPVIASGLIRTIGSTLRVKLIDPDGIFDPSNHTPAIFAFWHNRVGMLPYFHNKFIPHRKLVVMISRSRDGQTITDIAARFGILAARGSTSRHGIPAFRQLLRELIDCKHDVGVTPDGPRGPRHDVKRGIVTIAQMSGYPIVPLTYHAEWKLEFKSWDRFQMPLPFSKCTFVVGHPIPVPQTVDEPTATALCNRLRDELGK